MVVKGSYWFPQSVVALKSAGSLAMFVAIRLASSGVRT
jgi:hypothetical protein